MAALEKALRYLNQDKPTYVIPTGDAPSWEPSDELVLSKLWPHLDPFGLVGFCVERNLKVSLDEQVNHLLNLYDSDFDATLFRQLACRVPKEKVARVAAALLEIDMDVVSEMIQKSKDTKMYRATTEAKKHINRIIAELQSVGDKIHGTTAQMLDMRNEIRGNVNAFGILGRIKDKFLDQADAVAPKSLTEVPISQRQLRPLLIADFGERAMWVPGADDHMRTLHKRVQTRTVTWAMSSDLNLCIYTPALARSHCLQ
ncbi:BQ5605_C029g10600 [Microbotryum silenes-dioicae]|uniref:BQ5605_C029g10600 protein n=1 Tax=Microbotryum silenes-dioicae TaxID=796604 RepID=A0A2X0MMB5_9BASI|nr:BQ5605_C029g10600 [Microbotryum silenes-dioicae]